MRQTIVVTMAGRGSRFYDAGYSVPKYQIEAHGRTLFEWSLRSLEKLIDDRTRLVFVCLAENRSTEFVSAMTARLGLKDIAFLQLDAVTDGQATSAYLSRHLWLPDAPLTIYNIDTYVDPQRLDPAHIPPGSDGWIPCFRVPGDHWSFVAIDGDGWATAVAEKRRISDFASIGLYWFASAADFVVAYGRYFTGPQSLVGGERYVAPVYSELIAQGSRISIADIAPNDVHVLGTPAELQAFMERDPKDPAISRS